MPTGKWSTETIEKHRKANELKFIKLMEETVGDEYSLLSGYVKSGVKVKLRHNLCSTEYEVTPNDFQQGKRCPICARHLMGAPRRKNKEQFMDEVKKKFGSEYEILGDYKNNKIKVEVKHNLCGNVYLVSPSNLLRGRKCPKCSHKGKLLKLRWSNDEFIKSVYEIVGDEYTFLENYVNGVTPIKIRHNVCEHIYNTTPGNFIHHGKRCPKCQYSRGEERIEAYLASRGIQYEAQYRIEKCKNEFPLPFDFAIFENNKLKLLIEYDGEFHFYKKFRTDQQFELQKKRDAIKNRFCIENKIMLLRIPYWEFNNIERILDKEL